MRIVMLSDPEFDGLRGNRDMGACLTASGYPKLRCDSGEPPQESHSETRRGSTVGPLTSNSQVSSNTNVQRRVGVEERQDSRPSDREQAGQNRTPVLLGFRVELPPVEARGRWRERERMAKEGPRAQREGSTHRARFPSVESLHPEMSLAPGTRIGPNQSRLDDRCGGDGGGVSRTRHAPWPRGRHRVHPERPETRPPRPAPSSNERAVPSRR